MFKSIMQFVRKRFAKLQRRWVKHRVEDPKSRTHKRFVPAIKGKPIKELQRTDVDKFSSTEYSRPKVGLVQTYIVRNPKTGTVVVMKGTLNQLKRTYPDHEVVPPQIQ